MSFAEDLKKSRLFAGFEQAELETLATKTEHRKVAAREVVLRMGDANQLLHLIRAGHVDIEREVGEESVWLATLEPGDTFGEMSLIDGGPATATVRAAEDCEVLLLHLTALNELFHEHPVLWGKFWYNMAADLKRRLNESNAQIQDYAEAAQILTDKA